MPQENNRNFYDDFGKRLAFIREKRGLTLTQLSGGSASTAKSWEDGSRPAPDKWEAVAGRLNLSVSLVFLGEPSSKEDFDFVAKFTDEIGSPVRNSTQVGESPAAYGDEASIESRLIRHLRELIAAANGDRGRLGWIEEQVAAHLTVPAHWKRQGKNDLPFLKHPSQTSLLSAETGKPLLPVVPARPARTA